jgi:hypothetical protein
MTIAKNEQPPLWKRIAMAIASKVVITARSRPARRYAHPAPGQNGPK